MSIRRKLILVTLTVFLFAMSLVGSALLFFHPHVVGVAKGRYALYFALLTLGGAALIAGIICRITGAAVKVAHELAGLIDRCRITGHADEVPENLLRRNDEAGMLSRAVGAMMPHMEYVLREKEYMAYHDSLTQLKNRYRLKEDVAAMLAQQDPFSFVLMDIDDFKQINDADGHAQGDRLLVEMAGVLTDVCAEDAQIYRWGGDEFVLLIPGSSDACRAMVERVMQQVQSKLTPFQLRRIGVSMGVCPPSAACKTYGDLLVAADSALGLAKKQGKGRYIFCENDAAPDGDTA